MPTRPTSKDNPDVIQAPILIQLPEPERDFNTPELWLTLPGAKTLLKLLTKAILEEERKAQ